MMFNYNYKSVSLVYILKFSAIFCTCYFGTLAVIGLSAPGGFYSPVVQNYFDYTSWLRNSILHASKWLLSVFNYDTVIDGRYLLKVKEGYGVRIVYSCLGVGIMSFWIAFIAANKGILTKKLEWMSAGLLLIWLANITRISLLLVALSNHWSTPFFDHHTWFNIFVYSLIFGLIYFYDRSCSVKAGPVKPQDVSMIKRDPASNAH